MNPLSILVLLYLLDQKKPHHPHHIRKYSLPPSYFDTLNIELLLDKLQSTVNTLDKVNRLSQIVREPKALAAPTGDSEFPAPPDTMEQLAPLMQMAQGVDIKSLMQNIGPLMSMFANSQEK
jgi:hypothetical protein